MGSSASVRWACSGSRLSRSLRTGRTTDTASLSRITRAGKAGYSWARRIIARSDSHGSFDGPKGAGSGARWTGLAGLDGTAELFVMKATLAEDLGHGLEITLSSGTARLPISR